MICPSGKSVSIPLCKNISVFTHPETLLELFASHPTEGRIMIVTYAGWDAVDAAAFCLRRDCRAGDEPVSDQQHADERCCSARRSRVVLTPRRRRQVCGRQVGPTGRGQATYSASDGDKKARSPGSAKETVKTIACGNAGLSGVSVGEALTCFTLPRGLRVQRAPRRSPRPLWAEDLATPRALRAARAQLFLHLGHRHCEEHLRRSNPYFLCGEMDCFASLAMTER